MTRARRSPSAAAPGAAPGAAPASDPIGPVIEIGQLGRAHGLKGEVALQYYADSLEWLQGPLWLRSGAPGRHGALRPVKVADSRRHNGQVLVRFEGVADRTAAEHLRGVTVMMPEASLPESDDETLYLRHLLGLNVVVHETNACIGVLAHVSLNGGQELWSIEGPDGREVLFPAVPEFVDSVDFEKKEIRIMPPPGLLELYE